MKGLIDVPTAVATMLFTTVLWWGVFSHLPQRIKAWLVQNEVFWRSMLLLSSGAVIGYLVIKVRILETLTAKTPGWDVVAISAAGVILILANVRWVFIPAFYRRE